MMRRIAFAVTLLCLQIPTVAAQDRPQWRAVWVDAFNPGIKTPQQVDRLIADVRLLHCNTIIAQVRKRGDALFRKSIEPFADDAAIPEGFDPLADLLEKGRQAGLQIHAWVNVNTAWPGSGPPPKSPKHLFHQHGPAASDSDTWLTRDDKGNVKFSSGYFTDPGHPAYAEHFITVVSDLVKNYPVDGIHLDFVRYPETEGSVAGGYGAGYNPTNVKRFNQANNRTGTPSRNDPLWQQWRRDQVTQLVRDLRRKLLAENPHVILSGALIPWGAGPANEAEWKKSAPYNRVFQDWHAWRKEGLLDVIIPMNYDREANPAQQKYFDQWILFETQYKHKSQTIIGIGAYMNTPADTVAQTKRALAANADGVCFFSYGHFLKKKDGATEPNLTEYRRLLVHENGPGGAAPPFAKPAALPVVARLHQAAPVVEQAKVGKRPMTIEDLWNIDRLGPPSISPDGSWVVVELTSFDTSSDNVSSELWLLSTDGKQQRQLTNSGGRNSGPRWSPDGRHIAFVSKRTGDDSNQIYIIAPEGGEARRITKVPYGPSSLKWSADGQKIYFIGSTWTDCQTDADHQQREKELKDAKSKAVVITDAAFRYWDRWLTDGKRPMVFVVDVATGQHKNLLAGTGKHLPPYEASANDYDVAPDGKELCFVAENVKEIGLDNNHDLFTIDLTVPKPTPKNLTSDNPAHDTNPVYHPNGQLLAFLRQTTKFFYADRNRIMVMDRTTGRAEELCPPGRPLDRSAANPRWLPINDPHVGPTMIAEVEDQGYVKLGLFSAADPARLLPTDSSNRSVDVAKLLPTIAFLRSNFDHPAQVIVGDPRGQKRRIDKFNDDITGQWKLGKVEEVWFEGSGGKKVQMWVVYPPDFDPNQKWPLVQIVHGGPHNAITTDFSFRWNPQLWAAQGWVIGVVNFHGSSGFGQDFTDSITGDLGTKPLQDIEKATDWFLAKPWIDKNRIAAAGASYGGYMMAWMNGHTDRYKTLVCHAGVYNWHSMMASDWVRGRERSLGAPPWGDMAKIDQQNAQRLAANFKTPTLVLHGEKDYRVPIGQGFEFYNTLRQKGVPTRLVYFPDENHWILKAQNSLVWHREVFSWLEKWIGKGPTP
jgi:dipeptidyl aminopeptidase/acylaminoacyl peptidase/uncharacterized lipoprotein YddW (UPF0748 family)